MKSTNTGNKLKNWKNFPVLVNKNISSIRGKAEKSLVGGSKQIFLV